MTELEQIDPIKMMLEQGRITRLFQHLLMSPKPDLKNITDKELFTWAAKYYIGLSYFKLGIQYHNFVSYITQYYPFSHLYKNSLIHASNKEIRKVVVQFEKIATNIHIPILIYNGSPEGTLYEFLAYTQRPTQKLEVDILEKEIQKKYRDVYIRIINNRLRIIVPNALIYP
ncbi:MAG TPA: hypothetical protein VMR41_04800 [Patescibacteria group bacterium]|nr:hypothetical protein [Patescibacteria group bacterium]